MKYHIDFQYLPKDADRPIDDGTVVGIEAGERDFALVPNIGDHVHVDSSIVKGRTFNGRVRSRLFTYIVTEDEVQHCAVNIVVEESDDDWGKLIKE